MNKSKYRVAWLSCRRFLAVVHAQVSVQLRHTSRNLDIFKFLKKLHAIIAWKLHRVDAALHSKEYITNWIYCIRVILDISGVRPSSVDTIVTLVVYYTWRMTFSTFVYLNIRRIQSFLKWLGQPSPKPHLHANVLPVLRCLTLNVQETYWPILKLVHFRLIISMQWGNC